MNTGNPHHECGRHSGIPECCIDWFIGPWSSISIPGKAWALYWKENDKARNVEYIRCPTCIKKSIVVKIKGCDCESQ
jgi:hypothetical protein